MQQLKKLLTFSKLKTVHFNYGPINRNIVSESLLTQGYCVFRDTGISSKEHLVEQHEEIFDTIPGEIFDTSKLIDYSQGTDAREVTRKKNEKGKSIPVLGITESTIRDNFIGYHCELAYTNTLPKIASFTCLDPGENKNKYKNPSGMTPISNQYGMFNDLKNKNPKFAENLLKYGIRYWRRYPSAEIYPDSPFKTWQDSFGYNKSKIQMESIVTNLGYNFTWLENDDLRLDYTKPAVINHKSECGNESFANSILGFHGSYFDNHEIYGHLVNTNPKLLPLHCTLGDEDGTEFTTEEMKLVFGLYHKNAIAFEWQKGDVMIMDNIWWAHGRTPVFGDGRDIVAMFGVPLLRQEDDLSSVNYLE